MRARAPASVRALAVVVGVAGVVVLASSCPDPCVFLGGGCNDNDDCGAGALCRKTRDFETFGCALVEGRCVSFDDDDDDERHRCGSVGDCDEGECCDPATDTCVGEAGYTSLDCDEHTCGDCNDTAFGERCELNDDCDDDEACSADGINGFGTISQTGVCRPRCDGDDDCPATQRCSSAVCSVTIGSACTLLDALEDDESSGDPQCLGITCTQLDAAGERVEDAYCTDLCFDPGDCPNGFVCDDDTNACRRL